MEPLHGLVTLYCLEACPGLSPGAIDLPFSWVPAAQQGGGKSPILVPVRLYWKTGKPYSVPTTLLSGEKFETTEHRGACGHRGRWLRAIVGLRRTNDGCEWKHWNARNPEDCGAGDVDAAR